MPTLILTTKTTRTRDDDLDGKYGASGSR